MGRGDGQDQRPGDGPQLRGGERTSPSTSTPPVVHAPPAPLDPDEPAEVVHIGIWIKPLDQHHDQVHVEIDAAGYDAALKYDYDIPAEIDDTGRLSKKLLTGLITRDLIRDIAAELQVSYED